MMLACLGEAFYQGCVRNGAFLFGNCEVDKLRDRKIILWGTGDLAHRCVSLLRQHQLLPDAFCDNNPAMWGRKYLGKQVISPKEAYQMNRAYFILCVQGWNLWLVSRQVLARYGSDFSVFFLHGFGDFFDDSSLMNIVMNSINTILQNEVCYGHKTYWHDFLEESNPLGMAEELCLTTEFWDTTILWLVCIPDSGKPASMLDIGPGWGLYSIILNRLWPGLKTTWVNYSQTPKEEMDVIDQLHKQYDVRRIYGFIEDPKFLVHDTFDLIILTEVLEHFSCNPVPTLKKISSWLTPGGALVISTPTPAGDPTRIYDSWKDMPVYSDVPTDLYAVQHLVPRRFIDPSKGHIYIYNTEELKEIFSLCNLEIIRYEVNARQRHQFMLRRKALAMHAKSVKSIYPLTMWEGPFGFLPITVLATYLTCAFLENFGIGILNTVPALHFIALPILSNSCSVISLMHTPRIFMIMHNG